MLVGLWMAVAWADCGPAWRADVEAALGAWGALDERAFLEAVARARGEVGCVEALVAPEDAATWHLMEAVAAWYSTPGDRLVEVHLGAAVAAGLDAARWPEVLAPGSPLAVALERGAPGPLAAPLVVDRGRQALWVDGVLEGTADPGTPAIVQLATPRGVVWTRALPAPWPALPAPPRRGLGVAAAASAGVAAALWGAGVGTRVAWEGSGDPRWVDVNHGLLGASAGALGLATGLAVAAVVDAARSRRAP